MLVSMIMSEQEAKVAMDVKEAVQVAREYVTDLFAGEEIMDVGLEEVVFDDLSDTWKITVGFSRPWDRAASIAQRMAQAHLRRSYKVVSVNDTTEEVESIKDRLLTPSG